ncbi:spermatogenesis-associated protein 32 [Pteropus vampyrus]|uniref:Spermatogenesis-associated protein 32 n=1 Tax=Pteropus vampyrus TaxID=132908 RepID=A0A6P3R6X0_PTEVA|nr:spermatogenesis-associated protein 32 [Pteropus vampyrus]
MGVTGANGLPCCSKESVDIMETQDDVNQHEQAQEEDESDVTVNWVTSYGEVLENELLELETPQIVDLDVAPELEMEVEPETKAEPCPAPTLNPEAKQDSHVEAYCEDPEQQDKTESLHSCTAELTQQDASQGTMTLTSNYLSSTCKEQENELLELEPPQKVDLEDQEFTYQRSIHVQTSKHLFWADKFIQASEYNLKQETSRQPGKKNTDKTKSHPKQGSVPKNTPCSKEQLQNPSIQPDLPDTVSDQPPSAPSPSPTLQPSLGLEDLINFASSLAVASSNKMDLPSLEHMIKTPPQKAMEPSTEPMVENASQPAKDKPEQEKLSELPKKSPEKPLETEEPHRAQKLEHKNFFDCRKPGIQKTTIQGQLKLLQSPAVSPPQQGDEKNSVPVPGAKKGSPLLLKIHFKLSSPSSPREMTKQNQ